MIYGGGRCAEQLALAGTYAGHDVVLLTTTPTVAHHVQVRLAGSPVRIVDLGLDDLSRLAQKMRRYRPMVASMSSHRPGGSSPNSPLLASSKW